MLTEQHNKPSPAPDENMKKSKSDLPPKIRKKFAAWGRKGGLSGSREDKVKAGRLSAKARKANAKNNNHESKP